MRGVNIVALAGGIGAARFLRGVLRAADPAGLTVVVNTGDDMVLHGLRICPDLDTVTYTLGGGVHPEQGWGRAGESYAVANELRDRYGRPDWFTLGDRDLATHVVRSELLRDGRTLTDATAVIGAAWGVPCRLLPMTDDPVATRIATTDGRDLHFQEWWVRHRAQPPVAAVHLDGAEHARPTPAVRAALEAADAVLLCPSNPVVSIGTILRIPGIVDALADLPVVGVSPIVGGRVVRGMADVLLRAVGSEVSAAGVAALYRDFLDGWVIDAADAGSEPAVTALGVAVAVTDTIMTDLDVTTALARTALALATR